MEEMKRENLERAIEINARLNDIARFIKVLTDPEESFTVSLGKLSIILPQELQDTIRTSMLTKFEKELAELLAEMETL